MPLNLPSEILPPTAVPEILRAISPFGKQILIETVLPNEPSVMRRGSPNLFVRVIWTGEAYEFAAEVKTRNTPRVLDEALRQARRSASVSGRLPMVIVPFLGEKRVDRLLEEGVSGLDLCGNGLVVVPGRLLLRRTGQPNRYPESRPARFAYRGATSLVPRVFLRRLEFGSVGEIKEEIEKAGAFVALSTVSKALARMADDLIIERSADKITLLQPDKLLDTLAESFNLPKPERALRAKATSSLAEIFCRTGTDGPSNRSVRLVLSGASSQDRYTAGMRADTPVLYCDDLSELRRRMGDAWQPTDRFADMIVIETRDPTPFFDTRCDSDGVAYASPVQTYLELIAGDEKRDREIAQQIRSRILRDLGR